MKYYLGLLCVLIILFGCTGTKPTEPNATLSSPMKVCGEDSDCFKRAITNCALANSTQYGEDYSLYFELRGIKDTNCIMYSKTYGSQDPSMENLEMICTLHPTANGEYELLDSADFSSICSGSMIDYLSQQ